MSSTQPSKDKINIILITGMHRCGTSAMAGCFFNSDFNFGNSDIEDLKRPKKDNEKGHYESHDFVRLSNNVLHSINTNWHFVVPPHLCSSNGGNLDCPNKGTVDYPIENFNLTFHQDFSEMVVDCKMTLGENIKEEDNLIIKDPRASIILPVYIRAIIERSNKYKLNIINMMRDSYDVALSINKRDGMPFGESQVITKKYRDLLDRYREQTENQKLDNNIKFLDVNFEDLISNPINCLKSIEKEFSLNIIKKNEEKIINFIDPKLKHF